MVKNVLTWCFRYYIVLGCTVSSMALPTTYSVDGVNVGYEINRKWRSREENKITALAIEKRKRKRPVINRGHHHEVCSGYINREEHRSVVVPIGIISQPSFITYAMKYID